MRLLRDQRPKLDLFHPRDTLIRVHLDLLDVHARVYQHLAYYPDELTYVEKITLALEDRRFFAHHGVDLKSALRELVRALTGRRHGGASTIDMQLVRTATRYRELTLTRKVYEMLLAVLIQFRYSKIVILRSYLQCAYFGWNLRGEVAAAKRVFGKHPSGLTLDEAAVIAAMLVYPHPRYQNGKWQSRLQRRADYGKRIYVSHKQRFDKLPS
jgi:membrane peptidoglycan carboxypeptidase